MFGEKRGHYLPNSPPPLKPIAVLERERRCEVSGKSSWSILSSMHCHALAFKDTTLSLSNWVDKSIQTTIKNCSDIILHEELQLSEIFLSRGHDLVRWQCIRLYDWADFVWFQRSVWLRTLFQRFESLS